MVDKIRIMIVDDHPLFREGLRRVLEEEEDLLVEAEVADGQQAIVLARNIHPDVVLLDINLPSMNGLQVTREIKASLPGTAVINLTAYHDEEQIIHAINAGASAYYPKEVMPDKLIFAVRQVSQGQWVVDESVLNEDEVKAWLFEQYRQLAAPGIVDDSRFVPLSTRETEILQYVVRGSSNKEIAHTLQISQQTVKNHISSILRKLDVKDRTEAAVYALRHGWMRLEDTKPEE
ncbi:MAG TPA: response regulator transcription factor [Anaerolineae bacterium]|nr:response regulator transcription factor [Anaerolineae bacterium]